MLVKVLPSPKVKPSSGILVDANILIYSHVYLCAHGETNFNGNVMQTTRLIGFCIFALKENHRTR